MRTAKCYYFALRLANPGTVQLEMPVSWEVVSVLELLVTYLETPGHYSPRLLCLVRACLGMVIYTCCCSAFCAKEG